MQQDKEQVSSFSATTEFKDPKNFPYGFKRSGEFTQQQAELLARHGHAYHALHAGDRAPLTAEEEAFILFCNGEHDAQTGHEKAWKRYLTLCDKRAHRPAVSLSSAARENSTSNMDSDWDSL